MRFFDCASAATIWSGYHCYRDNKVKNLYVMSRGVFTADVLGSRNDFYSVRIDVNYPTRSKCNCSYIVDEKRVFCEHMLALYFTVFPEEIDRIHEQDIPYYAEKDLLKEIDNQKMLVYICGKTKEELCEDLYRMLVNGPDWQYDDYIKRHGIDKFQPRKLGK